MKKVLINACYGGFGCFSEEAIKLYQQLGGQMKVHLEGHDRQIIESDEDDVDDVIIDIPYYRFYFTISEHSNQSLSHLYNEDEDTMIRTDPILLQVVEQLGDKASANYSRHIIEVVPDDFEYYIDEYDGCESIHLIPILNIDKLIALSSNRDELKKYLDDMKVRHSN